MVSSFSPRPHSGPTVVTRSRSKSPHKKRFMLRSSPQTLSSPFNSPAVKITKSPALRNFTPLRHKTIATSPIKFPLSLATTNELNTATTVITPPNLNNLNRLNKESPGSPTVRHTMQRGNRAGIGVENGSLGSPLLRSGDPTKNRSSLSPVKRGRGSPAPKRRASVNYNLDESPFPGPSLAPLKAGALTMKRNSSKKNTSLLSTTERPTYAKSRPQARTAEFATPTDPASKIRRIASVKNISTAGPLPSASIHCQNLGTSGRSTTKETSSAEASSSTAGMEWVTPQNYKLARPNPAAFHSTGFIPKRGRLSIDSANHHQPETPCKKLSSYSVQMSGILPTGPAFGESPSPLAGSKARGFSLHGRRDSMSMNTNDLSPTPLGGGNLSLGCEFDAPSTPTKSVYNTNLIPLFGNVGGTKRKGESRPQSPYSIGTGRATRARLREAAQTKPQDNPDETIFPDASFLSIQAGARRQRTPQTPAKDHRPAPELGKTLPRTPNHLPLESSPSMQVSPNWRWKSRFSNEVRCIGYGEFSQVYLAVETRPTRLFKSKISGITSNKQLVSPRVSSPPFQSSPPGSPVQLPPRMYAIKKSKTPYSGLKDRDRRLEEVRILMELGTHDHVVKFVDQWEENRFLFIQTEYCENGSLDKFLDKHGSKGRLDEFRVWKIMIELSMGIKHIHDCGFMHLDIKPANVLISFDGTLKISDFGMATRWPAQNGIEREGDRTYLAPEVIQTNIYDKPVDIFSLGLTIIEVAGNEGLPPNGVVWQSLRSGDLSLAPILSTSVSGEFVLRDEKGEPISTQLLEGLPSVTATQSFTSDSSSDTEQTDTGLLSPSYPKRRRAFYRTQSGSKKLLHDPRLGDLVYPPTFMECGGLERIVQLMLAPDASKRPRATDILNQEEVKWVDARRRCPATIFEGLWGPDPSYQASINSGEIVRPIDASLDTSIEDYSMLSDL